MVNQFGWRIDLAQDAIKCLQMKGMTLASEILKELKMLVVAME